MRADSAILQRLIHTRCWFAPLILRLGANQHLAHPGDIVFRRACAMGLEGIVSKRKDSTYRSGRSPDWLKSKNPACEAVKREAKKDWGKERWTTTRCR
jgi:ATP-dependent DNA ligase